MDAISAGGASGNKTEPKRPSADAIQNRESGAANAGRSGVSVGDLVGWTIAGLAILLAVVLTVAPPFLGLDDHLQRTLGVVIGAVGLWATGVVPPHYTSLLFMFFAVALPLAAAPIVFSGFHSSAVWLVFGD